MRVLLTCPSLRDRGGVGGYYRALLPFLQNSRHAITVLEVGSTRGRGGALHPLLDPLRFFFALCLNRYDLVHLNPSFNLKSFLRAGAFVILAKLRRRPVLAFFRGWRRDFEPVVRNGLFWFFRLAYGRVDAFVVLAAAFAERLRAWGVRRPIHRETTAVDDRLLEGFSLSKKLARPEGEKIAILFLSSVLREKGVYDLLEAVVRLRERGVKFALTIAGDGPDLRGAERFIRSHRLEERITLAGYVNGERKRSVLASHDLFCLPSWEEGLPNCVLEAMAFGLPVITCPVGGIPDFFKAGEMGELVAPGDPVGLADAIARLAADRAARRRMARFNHDYARCRFLASAAARRLVAIYDTTVAAGRNG